MNAHLAELVAQVLEVAERAGLRIHEVPVDWVDDPDSRVDVVATAVADLKGVARMLKDLATASRLRSSRRPSSHPSNSSVVSVVNMRLI